MMRTHLKRYAPVIAVLVLSMLSTSTWACSSVIVGKKASANGYVMLGHTEDISPGPAINHHNVPRQSHAAGSKVTLREGGQLDQVPQTWKYIWSEVPGEKFCDSYLNEWGVTIASNQCPSKEEDPDLTEGGIGYMLRQLVAQRAKSAREGVRIAGELVDKFGYHSSGRSYMICDPDEGWVFCAINGRHWLARRVPDDEIAVIANSYTVGQVDFTDTVNFLAAEDLVDYALSRGWYNPAEDSVFDFASVFADTVAAAASYNVCRQWTGLRYVTADTVQADWGNLPFSLTPDRKFTVSDVMAIMRDHYENTALYRLPSDSSNPHENQFMTVCSRISVQTFVVELRKDLPKEIGFVYWLSLGKPCYSYLVPFYFGLAGFPEEYFTQSAGPDSGQVDSIIQTPRITDLEAAYWKFINYSHRIDSNYVGLGRAAVEAQQDYEGNLFLARSEAEAAATEVFSQDMGQAIEILASFSTIQYLLALGSMDKVLSDR